MEFLLTFYKFKIQMFIIACGNVPLRSLFCMDISSVWIKYRCMTAICNFSNILSFHNCLNRSHAIKNVNAFLLKLFPICMSPMSLQSDVMIAFWNCNFATYLITQLLFVKLKSKYYVLIARHTVFSSYLFSFFLLALYFLMQTTSHFTIHVFQLVDYLLKNVCANNCIICVSYVYLSNKCRLQYKYFFFSNLGKDDFTKHRDWG